MKQLLLVLISTLLSINLMAQKLVSKSDFENYLKINFQMLDPIEGIWQTNSRTLNYVGGVLLGVTSTEALVAIVKKDDKFQVSFLNTQPDNIVLSFSKINSNVAGKYSVKNLNSQTGAEAIATLTETYGLQFSTIASVDEIEKFYLVKNKKDGITYTDYEFKKYVGQTQLITVDNWTKIIQPETKPVNPLDSIAVIFKATDKQNSLTGQSNTTEISTSKVVGSRLTTTDDGLMDLDHEAATLIESKVADSGYPSSSNSENPALNTSAKIGLPSGTTSDDYTETPQSNVSASEDNSKTANLSLVHSSGARSESSTYSPNSYSSSNITGTGFALSPNGYIATCNHVVEGAHKIIIKGVNGDFSTPYLAAVIKSDLTSDIAILKIVDGAFTGLGDAPYTIKSLADDVGTSIYTLGYPLLETMGAEIKLTNGIISAKSGFKGDKSSYQISASAQPGNSGGPLFDTYGNLIGVINAKHVVADNVTYALKASFLLSILDSLPKTPALQLINSLTSKALPEQVKDIMDFVYIIEVE